MNIILADTESINNTSDSAETNAIIDNIAADLLKQKNIVETPNMHSNTLWDLELEKEHKDAIKGKIFQLITDLTRFNLISFLFINTRSETSGGGQSSKTSSPTIHRYAVDQSEFTCIHNVARHPISSTGQ